MSHRIYSELAWIYQALPDGVNHREQAEALDRRIRRFKQSAGYRLLDVGCGCGRYHRFLGEPYEIVGLDASSAVLELARRNNPRGEYQVGDIFALERENDSTFDVTVSFDALCYCQDESSLRQVMAGLARTLVPGGLLILGFDDLADNFLQNRAFVTAGTHQGDEVILVENAYDPEPGDSWFEHTFTLIRRRGKALSVDVERHRLGLFSTVRIVEALHAEGLCCLACEPLREIGSSTSYANDGRVFVARHSQH